MVNNKDDLIVEIVDSVNAKLAEIGLKVADDSVFELVNGAFILLFNNGFLKQPVSIISVDPKLSGGLYGYSISELSVDGLKFVTGGIMSQISGSVYFNDSIELVDLEGDDNDIS